MEPEITIALLGDNGVGKSTLLQSYINREWDDNVPTIIDTYRVRLNVGKGTVRVEIRDNTSSEEFRGVFLRGSTYDIFLLCYSCSWSTSLENMSFWLRIVDEVSSTTPIYLFGTKKDIFDSDNEDHVSSKEGKKVAKTIGAVGHRVTSSLEFCQTDGHRGDVEKLFTDCIIFVLQNHDYLKRPASCYLCHTLA